MTPDVNHAQHFHALTLHDEKHFVGKPADQHAPGVLIKQRMAQRILGHRAQHHTDLLQELVPQADAAGFIPIEGFGQLGFRLGPNDYGMAHFERPVMRA